MIPLRIIEIIWLIVAILTFVLGVYKTAAVGLLKEHSYWFFICTFLAAFMYSFRRTQRINYQKQKKEEETKGN